MIYTTTRAAVKLGCHRETVLRIARRLKLGTAVRGAVTLTEAEIERIRPEIRGRGNPNMVAGNDLWRRRKKRKKRAGSSR